MAILSKACKPDNFESHNSLTLSLSHTTLSSFANIPGLHSNFVLAICETNFDDSIDSSNFYVRSCLPLIRIDSVTHVHGLTVYVKDELIFSKIWWLCFHLALLHSVPYFFFLYRSKYSSLRSVIDDISSNTDKVFWINPSANAFVFIRTGCNNSEYLKSTLL